MPATMNPRQRFEALFTKRVPTREEMLLRPDFLLLAATVGMSLGECWDALVKKSRQPEFDGNVEHAAADWYAQVSAPRF